MKLLDMKTFTQDRENLRTILARMETLGLIGTASHVQRALVQLPEEVLKHLEQHAKEEQRRIDEKHCP